MQIIRKGVCAQEGDQTFVETVDRLWIFGMQEKKTVSAYAAKKFATSVAFEMDPQKLPGRGSAAVTIVKKREFKQRIRKDIIKKRLQNKLSDKCIEELHQNTRFVGLLDMVNSIQE